MDFLGLEKIFEMGPTELAELGSTSAIDFEKNTEKSKETQIRVKSYDSLNFLHHSLLLEKNEAPASSGPQTASILMHQAAATPFL